MCVKLIGILASACLFVSSALSIATPQHGDFRRDDSTQAIPPSEDPWYTAPDGYESASPGAILRNRTAPSSLISAAGANCSTAYQLLYRTTASQGNATFAVNTILVPQDPTNALLSYQIPYDSAYINSSPSYTLSQQVYTDIKNALGKGYFVTVPDYEGPLASFTAGHMSGYATLDGVRATLNGAELYGLPDDTLYATWGYSGGALATEWAAELQADYASDLSFAGSAMGGLTPNITSVLQSINMKVSAGLAPVSNPSSLLLRLVLQTSIHTNLRCIACNYRPPEPMARDSRLGLRQAHHQYSWPLHGGQLPCRGKLLTISSRIILRVSGHLPLLCRWTFRYFRPRSVIGSRSGRRHGSARRAADACLRVQGHQRSNISYRGYRCAGELILRAGCQYLVPAEHSGFAWIRTDQWRPCCDTVLGRCIDRHVRGFILHDRVYDSKRDCSESGWGIWTLNDCGMPRHYKKGMSHVARGC